MILALIFNNLIVIKRIRHCYIFKMFSFHSCGLPKILIMISGQRNQFSLRPSIYSWGGNILNNLEISLKCITQRQINQFAIH